MKTKVLRVLGFLAVVVGMLNPQTMRAAVEIDYARLNNFKDHGCNNSPGGAGGPDSGSDSAGGNSSTCKQCQGSTGIPEWWVDEPYINLHIVDEPLSYTTSFGQEVPFRFFYKQRYALPEVDEIPSLLWHNGSRDSDLQVHNYIYMMRGFGGTNAYFGGMTNAAWAHNWMMDIMYWDAAWEQLLANQGTTEIPFSHEYEALVFRPEGDITYFADNAGGGNVQMLTNDPSWTALSFFPYGYAYLGGTLNPDAQGVYYGYTNCGITLSYPDGSADVFTLGNQPYKGAGSYTKGGAYDTTSHALLTQRIDPQGRVTYIGYKPFTNSGSPFYRVYCVVDPDRRTNIFSYVNSSTFELQQIQDPFGRTASVSYNSSNWVSGIKDAVGTNNAFSYYGFGSPFRGGWISEMTTPYGNTVFSYYTQPTNTGTQDTYLQMATVVVEPDSAEQMFLFNYNSGGLVDASTNTPGVSGVTFDSGANGDANEALYLRDSFHWDRKQFADLSINPTSFTDLQYLTREDYQKATMKHWLLAEDGVSVAQTLSSERDPSPDLSGKTEGNWTWYAYGDTTPADEENTTEVAAIARLLPNGSNQFTTYNYYNVLPVLPWVSQNVQSYSTPAGAVGLLTNTFQYAANGIDLTNTANSLGQFLNLGYNTIHEVTTITDALNEVTSFGYGGGTLTSMALASGKSFTFGYNTGSTNSSTNINWLNQVTMQPENLTESITSWTDGLPRSAHVTGAGVPDLYVTNTWDNLNRLTGTLYQDGTTLSNIFAARDLVRSKDRLGNWTSNTFDGLDHLIGTTNPLGNATTYSWCGCGSLTGMTDPLGNTTTFNLNNQEWVTNVVFPDGSSLTEQYDLLGRLTKQTDGAGKFLEWSYNNQNLVTSVSDAYGQVRGVGYDAVGRPVTVTNVYGVVVNNSFDAVNRLTNRAWVDGGTEAFGYASNGLVAYTDQDQHHTVYGRDAAGRLTAVINALSQTSQIRYNALDQVMSLVDGLGHTTTWGYNEWGWLISKSNTLGAAMIQYAHDADGRVTNRWMMGTNTGYSFDAAGNLKSITYPAAAVSFTYDAANRLTNMADGVGTTAWTYTAASEIASETQPWTSDTVSYTYNQGRRASLTLGSSAQSYAYDNAWRLTGLSSAAGVFSYAYNSGPSPLPVGIGLPNGASIANAYDGLARLTNTALLNFWGHTLDGYGYNYDLWNLRTNVLRELGMTTNSASVAYDVIGEVTGWSAKEMSGILRQNEQLGYGFDAGGNLHARTNGVLTETFTVNSLNEISSVGRAGALTLGGSLPAPATNVIVNGVAAQRYGDLTFASTNNTLVNGTNTFTILATNLYGVGATNVLSVNLPSTVTCLYDANGNLTNDGLRNFSYDAENQLTNVAVSNQWQVGFAYDGLNRRRIERDSTWQSGAWVKTNETRFIYDGLLPLQERDANNNVLVTYTRGLDLSQSRTGAGGIGGLLARTTPTNGSVYYHSDASGNVTALMDAFQHIVARYECDPFGRPIGTWGTMANVNRYGYSSKEKVGATSIYSYGRRFYDPNLERWLNRDPIQEAGGINLYTFNRNNPLRFVDPYGLDAAAALNALEAGGQYAGEEEVFGGGPEDPVADVAAAATLVGALGYAAWQYFQPSASPPPTSPTPALPNATATTPAKPVPTTCPAKVKPISNPPTGPPGSKATATNPDGTPKQVRQYGPDGYPETDVDYGHGHELDPNGNPVGSPHVHDWEPNPNGGFPNRGPARPPQPGDPQP